MTTVIITISDDNDSLTFSKPKGTRILGGLCQKWRQRPKT